MKPSKMGWIFLAALAIELVNFFFLMPPLDVDWPPNMPFWTPVIGVQFLVLHMPGMILLGGMGDAFGFRGSVLVELFVSGYLTTVLLIVALTLVFQRLKRKVRE